MSPPRAILAAVPASGGTYGHGGGHVTHPQQGVAPPATPPVPAGTPVTAPRRPAVAEAADRLRAAATTEPGRLRLIGAVLALLVVSFGAVTAFQMADRASAADDVLHSSQPLSAGAADIYRSLADANP